MEQDALLPADLAAELRGCEEGAAGCDVSGADVFGAGGAALGLW